MNDNNSNMSLSIKRICKLDSSIKQLKNPLNGEFVYCEPLKGLTETPCELLSINSSNQSKKKVNENLDIELLFPTQLRSYYASAEF